jgi:hypothetical protein
MDKPAAQNATVKPDLSTIAPIGVDNGEHLVRKKELVAILATLFPALSIQELSDAINRAGSLNT